MLEDLKKSTERFTGGQRLSADQLAALLRQTKRGMFRFRDDGGTPNHPRWPVIIYWNVVQLPRTLDPAAVMEKFFESNDWGKSWRNGIYDYLHYHSSVHEVLGIARGSAKVRLGGDRGRTFKLSAGDVVILPAGTRTFWSLARIRRLENTTSAGPAPKSMTEASNRSKK